MSFSLSLAREKSHYANLIESKTSFYFTYVAPLDIRGHIVQGGPAGAVVDLTLAVGGHVLVGVHHSLAVLDGVLLGVVDQRVPVTGGLHGVVALLQLESYSIGLRNTIVQC